MKFLTQNWKTTLAGVIAAAAQVLASGAIESGDWKQIAAAVGTAVLGYLAKDAV